MWVEGQNGTGGGDPLTPSNSTPAAIAQNHIYEAQGNGYAIGSYTSITPSNNTPVTITQNNIYKAQGNGYAIEEYYNMIPKDPSNPVFQIEPGWIIRNNSNINGYLVSRLYSINPVLVSTVKSNPNNPQNFTYQNDGLYLITATGLVSTALTGVDRTSCWFLDKGVLGARMGASDTNSMSTVTNSTATNKITMTGTNSSYRTEFNIFRLEASAQ